MCVEEMGTGQTQTQVLATEPANQDDSGNDDQPDDKANDEDVDQA